MSEAKDAPPFRWKSRKLPANPLGALTPISVPFAEKVVGPVPSLTYSCGKLVVVVPPMYGAPLTRRPGVEAAPAEPAVSRPLAPSVVNRPVLGVVPPMAPGDGNEDVDPPSDTEVPPMVMALLTREEFGIDGRSPATSEHGAKDVADPQVPMTSWEVWPVAAPMVSAGVVPGVATGHVSHAKQLADTDVTVPLLPFVHVPGLPAVVQYQLFCPGVASV